MTTNLPINLPINLDDESTVLDFINTFSTRRGRWLANRLNLSGPGSEAIANGLSGYAWNKHTAIACRQAGEIRSALIYEQICDQVYDRLPEIARW